MMKWKGCHFMPRPDDDKFGFDGVTGAPLSQIVGYAVLPVEQLEALRADIERLREEKNKLWDAFIQDLVGHDPRCGKCGGLGRRMYGSTTTWRGGIGGQAMTTDVCDGCWGSGSATRPWPSHREFHAMKKAKEKTRQ